MTDMLRAEHILAQRNSNARTTWRDKKRTEDPMVANDRLPADLRVWFAQAALPWSPRKETIAPPLSHI